MGGSLSPPIHRWEPAITALAQGPPAVRDALASAGLPFPSTKLVPPALPPHFVERPRLHEALERATAGRVTVVSSHAGTGKTVLLASWLGARPGRTAWLSLDSGDNDASL